MRFFGKTKRQRSGLNGYDAVSDADRSVLEVLVANGARLDQPRHVLHYVYVRDEGVASVAAGELGTGAWETEVRPPAEGSSGWLVLSQRRGHVLTPNAIVADRATFEAVARKHDGEYDGWEASA